MGTALTRTFGKGCSRVVQAVCNGRVDGRWAGGVCCVRGKGAGVVDHVMHV